MLTFSERSYAVTLNLKILVTLKINYRVQNRSSSVILGDRAGPETKRYAPDSLINDDQTE